jgi:hypothetical protein
VAYLDDYIADKTKKYRDQYKGSKKKAEGISKRNLSKKSRINQEYIICIWMYKKRPFNTFILPKSFKTLKKCIKKDKFLFFTDT